VGAAVFIALCGLVIALLVSANLRPQPSRYEGVVVDKSITLAETYRGSGKILRLNIRGRGGENFTAEVNYDTYDRARVGMWARNDGSGIELYATEPPPAAASTKTEGAETPSVSAPR
jgi:hypothetical protein